MTTHTDPYFAEERGGTSDAPFRAMATHTDPYFPEERRSSPHEAFRNVTPEERSRARDSMLARLDESKCDSMSRFGLPRFQGWSSGGFSGGLRANARVEPYQSKPTLSYY